MSYVLSTLLPIFGLILTGFICRRTGRLGETAASELNRFVVWLSLPALLIKATALASIEQIWHPQFILVYSLSTLLVFAATLIWKRRSGRSLADSGLDALGAGYANTGYVGIPLCLFVLGEAGLQPALIATLIVVCVLFSIAIIVIETGLQTEGTALAAARKVGLALLKNPLVVSPLIGIFLNVAAVPIPDPALKFLTLLGEATTPCALVSLGAFLAHRHAGAAVGTTGLVLIKLVVHPLLTWFLAFKVFQLPAMWGHAAVLLSALPTGTGPFMLAEYYRREGALVSRTILLSTIGSLFTLSFYLYLYF
ncbi:AEC family transporter [Parathalassolituus penaei]|uniref:AEC family transporter n=1 Tax=Parathalassolituus penaei TaxID=2997323 RepID=A0A9X3EDJ8_9GAMM|nr:AEC family transporter [Parathalassolituus penaei]MCY0964735.1 AEC family transporter [Parathalassolituus penaei]